MKKVNQKSGDTVPLKGQCHEIFNHFLGLEDSTWAPYEQAKTVLRNFFISRRYSIAKFENWDLRSQRLSGHPIFSFDTEIFIFKIIAIGYVNTNL